MISIQQYDVVFIVEFHWCIAMANQQTFLLFAQQDLYLLSCYCFHCVFHLCLNVHNNLIESRVDQYICIYLIIFLVSRSHFDRLYFALYWYLCRVLKIDFNRNVYCIVFDPSSYWAEQIFQSKTPYIISLTWKFWWDVLAFCRQPAKS